MAHTSASRSCESAEMWSLRWRHSSSSTENRTHPHVVDLVPAKSATLGTPGPARLMHLADAVPQSSRTRVRQ